MKKFEDKSLVEILAMIIIFAIMLLMILEVLGVIR